jgi:dTDP-4-amino-4,6-dideoxygalactose transaminase
VNAVPVLVDIDPETLCMSADWVGRALSPRTRAICLVHLYSSMADMAQLVPLAREAGVPIIEDCSQAHGASWGDAHAGTLGDIGVFSMQQTKVMTAGEGGATITASPRIARRLEQLRADGRMFSATAPSEGELELEEVGEVLGTNLSLSEVQAALLLEALTRLEAENGVREANARHLDTELAKLPGVTPIRCPAGQTGRSYYQYVLRVDCGRFGWQHVETLVSMLSAELRFPVGRAYRPLNDNPLYRPSTTRGGTYSEAYRDALRPERFSLPECERAYAECITFHHRLLLGDHRDMEDVIRAFHKIWENHA